MGERSYAARVDDIRADIAAHRKKHRDQPEVFRRLSEQCSLLDSVRRQVVDPADAEIAALRERVAELQGFVAVVRDTADSPEEHEEASALLSEEE
jgi:hypothetical protein